MKPETLEAYENRARAYTMLDLDAEAQAGVATLAQMGFEVEAWKPSLPIWGFAGSLERGLSVGCQPRPTAPVSSNNKPELRMHL